MALKRKLTKAEFDKLSDEVKKHYKEGEYSDTYVLDTGDEDEDDPAALRRALLREREEKRRLAKENKSLKEAAEGDGEGDDDGEGEGEDGDPPARRGKKAKRNNSDDGDSDAKRIDASWKKKYDKDVGEREAKLSQKDEFIKKQLVNGTAERIATKISTSPKLLANEIAKRLTVDFDGDEPELVILGEDGKPSGLTLEKLEKEFVANKEFAAIIIGSKASGSGAPKAGTESKTGGGAPASDSKTDLSKLTGKDLAATLKARKEANA